ncbi:MAG TPA: phosphopantetheine-binding protein [Croceibacterium sp.]|nr:phosphopantetheine-binding protein [Croceibacterium sp.]
MTLTLQRLREDIAAMIEEDASVVGDNDNLMDLGLDSMRAMNLVMQWDEQGVPLDFADLAEAPTLAGLWAILEQRQN